MSLPIIVNWLISFTPLKTLMLRACLLILSFLSLQIIPLPKELFIKALPHPEGFSIWSFGFELYR
jgi:hypothetical protein